MTQFYNDGILTISHKYENSENTVDIEENIYFETLEQWTIYHVKYFKNSHNEQTVELAMQYQGSNYAHLKQLCFKPIENANAANFKFLQNI